MNTPKTTSKYPRSSDQGRGAAINALRRRGGLARTGDLARDGVRAFTLTALWREGRLIRIKAGLYQLPDALANENADLVQAAAAVPGGVLCLSSALDYYGLTDASPEEVHMAIPMGDWAPKVTEPPVRFVRFRSRQFEMQINEVGIGDRPVRIYSREKTLCDCLRLSGVVGLDVTLTALRLYIRSPHSNISKLLETARACRIHHRMLPYVEALTV